MIKLLFFVLLIIVKTEIIALYDFSAVNLNGEIIDIEGSSQSILRTNDLLSSSKGENSLRLNFDKNENVINKSKYNYIKNLLILREEINIRIDFDIRYSKNEKICLFCLKSSEKTPLDKCSKYDFAIIKYDNKLIIIFKDPKGRGCYHSERDILWKEDFEKKQTQSILFVYNKNAKYLFINDEKILEFFNVDNDGYVVNNWNEELDLNIGLEDLKEYKKTNGFLDIYKISIYDSKKIIKQQKKIIQNWIKPTISKLDRCNCDKKIELSRCFCENNKLKSILSGSCNCLEGKGVCRCDIDDKCNYDKCGICNGNGDCKYDKKVIKNKYYCKDKNLIIESEICTNVLNKNIYNQYLKAPVITYNGGFKTDILDLSECNPLTLELSRKCCQIIKFSTINKEFKYNNIYNYKYYLITKFENKEFLFEGEIKEKNALCKDKEELELIRFEKLQNDEYKLDVKPFLDKKLTIPLNKILKEETIYLLITLYKKNEKIEKCGELENENILLKLKSVILNLGYIDLAYQEKHERLSLTNLKNSKVEYTNCNNQLILKTEIKHNYIHRAFGDNSIEILAFTEPISFKNEKIHFAVKSFRNENNKIIKQIIQLQHTDIPINYSAIYMVLLCAVFILLLMILFRIMYTYHKIEHEIGSKIGKNNEYKILRHDEEFIDSE